MRRYNRHRDIVTYLYSYIFVCIGMLLGYFKMKKLITALILMFFLSVNAAYAYDINNISDNTRIISALKILEDNNQTDVLARLNKHKVKIIFYDLSLLSYSYAKHYAVASTDEYGDNYILINSNLSSSPKEALACLIAHESVHELEHATYEEEVRATITEAKTWLLLKDKVSGKYENDILVKRLNNLLAMHETGDNLIAKAISNNAFYQKQLVK